MTLIYKLQVQFVKLPTKPKLAVAFYQITSLQCLAKSKQQFDRKTTDQVIVSISLIHSVGNNFWYSNCKTRIIPKDFIFI